MDFGTRNPFAAVWGFVDTSVPESEEPVNEFNHGMEATRYNFSRERPPPPLARARVANAAADRNFPVISSPGSASHPAVMPRSSSTRRRRSERGLFPAASRS
jgi:hypothetical protein